MNLWEFSVGKGPAKQQSEVIFNRDILLLQNKDYLTCYFKTCVKQNERDYK